MLFLVGFSVPGLGQLSVGFIKAENEEAAQREIVKMLVTSGIQLYRIEQVTDSPTLIIHKNTITLTPLVEFNEKRVEALVALFQ